MPAPTLITRLRPANMRSDIFGGLTTAVVSLPMALTFGVTSGAGAEAGLYGAVLVGLFAAVFGGTSTLISEPTGPMTVVMTAVITRLVAANPEYGLAMAFTTVMVAGLVQIVFGILKLGRYITMMPYSVVSGFMSGIGVLLVLTQIGPLLGQPSPAAGAVGVLRALPTLIARARPPEMALAAISLFVLFAVPRTLRRFVPPQLLALTIGTAVAVIAFNHADIRTIGAIPTGLPRLVFPTFTAGQATQIVLDGVILGLLGCIDSLLTAMIADSLTREHHDSNRELIGQGIGNLVSGLFGGLPGAGATMGTVVNIQTGARSPLSAVIRSIILLAVVAAVAPLLSAIPMTVLAAIAVKVGVDILDWSFLGRAHRISANATLIMYGVMVLTVLVDLIVAVGVGVFVANILTIERLSRHPSTRVKAIDPSGGAVVMSSEERSLMERARGRVVLFHLSGPMIFGVAQAIARESAAMDANAEVLIIDVAEISMLGTTVALALENVIRDARGARKTVIIAGSSDEVYRRLVKLDVLEEGVRLVPDRRRALTEALDIVADTVRASFSGATEE